MAYTHTCTPHHTHTQCKDAKNPRCMHSHTENPCWFFFSLSNNLERRSSNEMWVWRILELKCFCLMIGEMYTHFSFVTPAGAELSFLLLRWKPEAPDNITSQCRVTVDTGEAQVSVSPSPTMKVCSWLVRRSRKVVSSSEMWELSF